DLFDVGMPVEEPLQVVGLDPTSQPLVAMRGMCARVALAGEPWSEPHVTQLGERDELARLLVENGGVEPLTPVGVHRETRANPVRVDALGLVDLVGCRFHDLVRARTPLEVLLRT